MRKIRPLRPLASTAIALLATAAGLLPSTATAADAATASAAARRGQADRAVSQSTAAASATALATPAAAADPVALATGLVERPLWLDTARVAEFIAVDAPATPTLRDIVATDAPVASATAVAKSLAAARDQVRAALRSGSRSLTKSTDVSTTTGSTTTGSTVISPVFVDANGHPRALPGGVIVTLHTALPDEAAEAMLKDAGLQPQRRLTDRSWLIASELGLPSLALANALQETGRFERVQPNWWTARQRK